MKSLKIFSCLLFASLLATAPFAQKLTTEKIPVSGNCGMCKAKIEKAAKASGANEANWDANKKILSVKYNSLSTNAAKIQEAVAAVGYDTRDVRATDEAYNTLHDCCKYERAGVGNETAGLDCCKDGKCSKEGHDGKDCCKKTDGQLDCCKDGTCTKEGHHGNDCCKKTDGQMDCCKDGKCTKPGHDGKGCCSK